MQINVTSIHQNKFRRTKQGHGFGYGTRDKPTADEVLLKKIYDSANPELRDRRRMLG